MLAQSLEEFGLNPEEAKVYIALLELGGAYASTIASKAAIPRVNCYYVLEKLRKKGFLTTNLKGKAKFFVPEPPQVLVNQMESRYQKAQKLLPNLLALTKEHAFKPIIRSYEGRDGIKAIFEQTLKAESELLGYTNLEALGDLLPNYLSQYGEKLMERQLKTRFLSPSTRAARAFTETFYPHDFPQELIEILFVNPKEFPFENHISIYDNFVAIVSLDPEELMGILIESSVYAGTQRAIFNLSWLGATAFVAQ